MIDVEKQGNGELPHLPEPKVEPNANKIRADLVCKIIQDISGDLSMIGSVKSLGMQLLHRTTCLMELLERIELTSKNIELYLQRVYDENAHPGNNPFKINDSGDNLQEPSPNS